MHRKLAEHGEQLEREDGVLGLGEVVPEAGHEDDGADGDGGGHQGHGVVGVPQVRHTHKEDAKAGRKEGEAHKVELLELLPAGLLVVVLGPRGREVADEGAGDTDDGVDDGDVEAPPPSSMDQQLGREVHAEGAPGDVDAEFGPAETNATFGR